MTRRTCCPSRGKTRAELHLRATTGATVVAIRRGADAVVTPTGNERLEAGDVLVLSGASNCIEEAERLLRAGAPEAPTEEQPAAPET